MTKICATVILSWAFIFSASAFGISTSVTVDGTQSGFVSSGITLDGTKQFRVKATGLINYCSGAPQCDATPDGSVGGESHCQSGTNAPFALCGSLIARIAGGTPFVVGTGVDLPKESIGLLEFGIQDFIFGDNSGSFTVKVSEIGKKKFILSGYVLGSDGAPFAGERVIIEGEDKNFADTTDSSGLWAVELKKGKYRVRLKRQVSFPKTLTPVSSGSQAAFSPKKIQVNLNSDTFFQNFTAVPFTTTKALFQFVEEGEFSFCKLSDPVESGLEVQMNKIALGTSIRYSDEIFPNLQLSVAAKGPFEPPANIKAINKNCAQLVSISDQAGIGVPAGIFGEGGSATIEIAPR